MRQYLFDLVNVHNRWKCWKLWRLKEEKSWVSWGRIEMSESPEILLLSSIGVSFSDETLSALLKQRSARELGRLLCMRETEWDLEERMRGILVWLSWWLELRESTEFDVVIAIIKEHKQWREFACPSCFPNMLKYPCHKTILFFLFLFYIKACLIKDLYWQCCGVSKRWDSFSLGITNSVSSYFLSTWML